MRLIASSLRNQLLVAFAAVIVVFGMLLARGFFTPPPGVGR